MTPAPRETVDHLVTPGSAVDGVLVVGMEASGVRLVGNALSLLGLAVIDSPAKDGAPSALQPARIAPKSLPSAANEEVAYADDF